MTERMDAQFGEELAARIAKSERTWLVLDYDGTLAEFAPTPDTILPDQALIPLIDRLARHTDHLRVIILSGRMFSHIQKLLPVSGILLAGTYGIEYQTWEGVKEYLFDYASERPYLEELKLAWAALIEDRAGFYLEDKGYTLALHASKAAESDALEVISLANQTASIVSERSTLHVVGNNRFLEVSPTIADKGQSLNTLLERFPWPDARILYIGDDDKDEQAFVVVREREGIPIVVAAESRPSLALYRLLNPGEVRRWLTMLADYLDAEHPDNLP